VTVGYVQNIVKNSKPGRPRQSPKVLALLFHHGHNFSHICYSIQTCSHHIATYLVTPF